MFGVMRRIILYLLFCLCLPFSGFAIMNIILPHTVYVLHDGGYFGMILGLGFCITIFSFLLLKTKWYFKFLIGVLVAFGTIKLSYSLMQFIMKVHSGPKDYWGYPRDDTQFQFYFFGALILSSIGLFEAIYRFLERRKPLQTVLFRPPPTTQFNSPIYPPHMLKIDYVLSIGLIFKK